ncbi:MAG: hypothetical protein M3619_00625 [Myxococcota bacterium]|nr:hypothetical protein [Myxococcota bacterium]
MANNDNASKVTWQINSRSQGNKRLRRLDKYDVGDEGSTESANEVGSDHPVGFVRKPGSVPIDFEFRQTKGVKPDCDWAYLRDSGEIFSLTEQVGGGQRTQYPEVRVSTYTKTGDKDGEFTYSVGLVALRSRAL